MFDIHRVELDWGGRKLVLETGKIARQLTATGYLAPGVPGTVRGLALAHKKFGKLSWKTDVMPAVELAEKGFPLSDALAKSLNREVAGAMARCVEGTRPPRR